MLSNGRTGLELLVGQELDGVKGEVAEEEGAVASVHPPHTLVLDYGADLGSAGRGRREGWP